jgi:CubicO group peptidase (beta-lactamase class C family)
MGSLALGAAACLSERSDGAPAPPASSRLRRSSPESLGIDPGGIAGFIEAVGKSVGGLHGFLLLRHAKVAAEGWWRPYGPKLPHMLFSLSKSFCSTAVGFAVNEGRLKVSDQVATFFSEDLPARLSDNQAAMTVKNLLTMNTGHDKDATGPTTQARGGNWARAFLALPVEHKPGSKFVYNSAATYMCSAIVQRVTGETVLDYLRPRLFDPLGIDRPTWETCPKGVSVGGWGLSITTEDIARFGQLFLDRGMWNGERLLPDSWIDEATKRQVPNGAGDASDWTQGYGYQFWRCRHGAYRGDGAFGQYCVVFPEQDAVLAITSGVRDMQAVLYDAWAHLLPAFKGAKSNQPLAGALRLLEVPFVKGQAQAPAGGSFSGRTFEIAANPQGVKSVSVEFLKGKARFRIEDGKGAHRFECGTERWGSGTAPLNRDQPGARVAARGGWTGDNEYTATIVFVETPFIQRAAFRFEEDRLSLKRQQNVSFGPTDLPELSGQAV